MVKTFYKHIDNGGIKVEIKTDEHGHFVISFETSYYGYPSIRSEFSDNGQLHSDDYRKMASLFMAVATSMDNNQKFE